MTIINMLELTGSELLGDIKDATFVGPRRTLPGGAPVSGNVVQQNYGSNTVVTYEGNRISDSQFTQWILPGCLEVADETTTLAAALTALREAEGLVGRQPDFHICDKRSARAYAEMAGDSIEHQPNIQAQIERRVAALTRFEDLGEGQEQLMANITAMPEAVRWELANQFRRAKTHGDYTVAVRDWNAMIGDYVRRPRGQATTATVTEAQANPEDFMSLMTQAAADVDAPFGPATDDQDVDLDAS